MTRRSAQSIDGLVHELISLAPDASATRIKNDPRLHSLELARRLTQHSAAALPDRPEESMRFASAALDVLHHVPSVTPLASSVAARASCSMGDAWRLKGNFERAEHALNAAVLRLNTPEEAALHLRSLAVLRWEQGRSDEAVGLLMRAERLFRNAGIVQDASTTIQLLILLHSEIDEASDAITLYKQLGPHDHPAARPWLTARTVLTAAFCLAHRPDLARPEEPLAALALGSALVPLVKDSNELLQLEWLAARTRGRMGYHKDAEVRLLALRNRFEPDSLDYHSLTLDLLALRVADGHGAQELLKDVALLPRSIHSMPGAVEPFLLGTEINLGSDPWGLASSLASIQRGYWRIHRLPVSRLPFA